MLCCINVLPLQAPLTKKSKCFFCVGMQPRPVDVGMTGEMTPFFGLANPPEIAKDVGPQTPNRQLLPINLLLNLLYLQQFNRQLNLRVVRRTGQVFSLACIQLRSQLHAPLVIPRCSLQIAHHTDQVRSRVHNRLNSLP